MTENTSSETAAKRALLIFEIGTEEIPARFLSDAISKLKGNAEKLFCEYRLCFGALRVFATPRRLSMLVEVDRSQTATQKEVWGPPENAAFDKEGKPTKAAESFAKSQGISIDDISIGEKGKGRYVFAAVKETSRLTSEVLPELDAEAFRLIPLPEGHAMGRWKFQICQACSLDIDNLRQPESTLRI